ncbi:hypothetical protein ABZ725_21800 [Streptomyces sp. NPDC006872]|uniref:hypothetical protein n=1 Tax=Streptomyces sp. NPDC006872 TaxID=3155720 RepID=UPI0033FA48A3
MGAAAARRVGRAAETPGDQLRVGAGVDLVVRRILDLVVRGIVDLVVRRIVCLVSCIVVGVTLIAVPESSG